MAMHFVLAHLNQLDEKCCTYEERIKVLESEKNSALDEIQMHVKSKEVADSHLECKLEELKSIQEKASELEERANSAAEEQIMTNCELEGAKEDLQAMATRLAETDGMF